MTLERELAAFNAKLPDLKDSEGKYALVKGDELVDVYGTYEDALKEGYKRFKLEPFMVRQIHAVQQVQFITRLAAPESNAGPS